MAAVAVWQVEAVRKLTVHASGPCDVRAARFNLSTVGWGPVASGMPPLQFRFLANYMRGLPVPLCDPGPSAVLSGLLLPLALANSLGEVEVTVLAKDANGCVTIVFPSVTVTLTAPSLTSLAEAYTSSGGGGPSGSAGNSTSGAWGCVREVVRMGGPLAYPRRCVGGYAECGCVHLVLVSIWFDDAAGDSSASSVLGVAASSLSSDAPAVAANNTATLLDSLTLAAMVLQVVTLCVLSAFGLFHGTHSSFPVFFSRCVYHRLAR